MGETTADSDRAERPGQVDEASGPAARGRTGPRPARRSILAPAALLLIALLVAWLAVGLSPRFTEGYVEGIFDPFVPVEGDGSVEPSYRAVDPDPGEARFALSYENVGPAPVTLSSGRPESLVVTSIELAVTDPRAPLTGTPQATVTVPPGEQVEVWVVLDLPCADLTAGTTFWLGDLRVRAVTLGVPRELDLPLPARVGLQTSTDRTCP